MRHSTSDLRNEMIAAARRRLWWGATHVDRDSTGTNRTDGDSSKPYGFSNIFFQNNQLIITCLSEEQAKMLVTELGRIAKTNGVLEGANIIHKDVCVTVTQPVDTALWTALQQDKESHLTRQTTPYGLITCIQRIKSSLNSSASASPSPAPA